MKKRIVTIFVALVAAGSIAAENAIKEEMHLKLFYAQGILEGITTENYPLIATNAYKLKHFSQSPSWDLRKAPEYQRLTTDFQRSVDAVARAADKRNVDGAMSSLLSAHHKLCHLPQISSWVGNEQSDYKARDCDRRSVNSKGREQKIAAIGQ